ncbi:hypothetical protein BANRA_05764 [Escherichia coli]|nr:hypothetical protein BANRA_05764 [Escherichia coli]
MWSNYAPPLLRILWRLVSGFHYPYAVLAGHGADGGLMGISGMQWFIYWGRQEWWQVRPLL